MHKLVALSHEARLRVMMGRGLVQASVIPTIGPSGRNAMVGKEFGPPKITNDGVTIAKEIDDLQDPFMDAGAKGLNDDAEKMNAEAGDGSSTFITLTRALDREGMKYLTRGVNVMEMRRGMENAAREAVRQLRRHAVPVEGEDLAQVATISAESPEMGELIARVLNKVGKEGVVTVEESFTLGIHPEIVEGLRIDRGYISPLMITDDKKMDAEYTDVPILVTNKRITQLSEIKPFIDKLVTPEKEGDVVPRAMVLICDDLDGEALKTLLFNKIRGGFAVLAVRATGYGEDKREFLTDIATVVGAKVVADDTGLSLANVGKEVLGSAKRVTATKDQTIIVGGSGDKGSIEQRIQFLRDQLLKVEVKLSKEKLIERIGKLSGGVAIIKVGATNEGDMSYLKDKLEDAINATRAAMEEGIVPGGGSELVMIANNLRRKRSWWQKRTAEEIGYDIVIEALSEPFLRIVSNAGKDPWPIIHRMNQHIALAGYDVANHKFEGNMYKAGIVDPVKVTRIAVQHAVSSSAIALTTEVVIVPAKAQMIKSGQV